MPSWDQVLAECQEAQSYDPVRHKYLKRLATKTGRNVIAYYSGWLQKPRVAARGFALHLDEVDKSGFMTAINGLDRNKGLDLILHTPGGSITALEALIEYLRAMFGNNIRAVVPQIAQSAGTMLALSCYEVVMGKHSSLGPIDPQVGGVAAHAIIEEAQRARSDIVSTGGAAALFWGNILQKYQPTLLSECERAVSLSESLVTKWLETGMFRGRDDATEKAKHIVKQLGGLDTTLTHGRHIGIEKARDLGVNVSSLESDPELQDAVLSVHHAYVLTLDGSEVYKVTENQNGIAFMQRITPNHQ